MKQRSKKREGYADSSPVLKTVAQTSLFVIKLLAIWLFVRGHQEPGGGFVAGLVIVVAIALQGLAFGLKAAESIFPLPFHTLLGIGVFLAASTAVGPLLFGQPILDQLFGYIHLPLLGEVEWSTAAVFDLGVFLVVVGSAKGILLSIAEEKLAQASTAPGESESPTHMLKKA